jgi:hypothetical protein
MDELHHYSEGRKSQDAPFAVLGEPERSHQ